MFNRILPRCSVLAPAIASWPFVSAFAPSIANTASYHVSTQLYSSSNRWLLTYDYIPDVLEKRGPFREGHIGLAKEMVEEGTCISGGPTLLEEDGIPNGALFIFTSKDAAESFIKGDPYIEGGIVTSHSISEWSVVVGTN